MSGEYLVPITVHPLLQMSCHPGVGRVFADRRVVTYLFSDDARVNSKSVKQTVIDRSTRGDI